MKIVVLYRARTFYFYDLDWRDALLDLPGVNVVAVNWEWLNPKLYFQIIRADYVILLHSIDPAYPHYVSKAVLRLLRYRRGRVVYFPRNEFKNFSRKRRFIKEARVDLTCSSLPKASADHLYGDLGKTVSLPQAANLTIYSSTKPRSKRPITLGGRTSEYPVILLDDERNRLNVLVAELSLRKPDWNIDYSDRMEDRFDRLGWAKFLESCRCTITTEAGSRYLDKSDQVQHAIEEHFRQEPTVAVDHLYDLYKDRIAGLPSGKHISSRHFEAMGCGTCQVLVEGGYNGLLEPDIHYVGLRRDFSNLDEVIEKVNDSEFTQEIVDRCHELVRSEHLHRHRVENLWKEMQDL